MTLVTGTGPGFWMFLAHFFKQLFGFFNLMDLTFVSPRKLSRGDKNPNKAALMFLKLAEAGHEAAWTHGI